MARFNITPFNKRKLHIGSVRCRAFNGRGAYPYSWKITTSEMSFTDGTDHILYINAGYLKIEMTWQL